MKGKFKGNKIPDKVVKPKPFPHENSRNAEEIVIPPEKRDETPKALRTAL